MSTDDIQFFDIGERVVVKIADIIFITEYDNDTDWYDACEVFSNIDSLMESIKQKQNKTKGK